MCLGTVDGQPCPARLHGKACAQISRGHAEIGCFTCSDCLSRKFAPGKSRDELTAEAIRSAEETMVLRLSQGAESTGASYSDYLRRQREYMDSVGLLGIGVMPSDDADVFQMFLSWLVLTRDKPCH